LTNEDFQYSENFVANRSVADFEKLKIPERDEIENKLIMQHHTAATVTGGAIP